jgi:hypothetical protein
VAVLILVALVKPTFSVPFLWLVLFLPGTLQPALFIVLGYIALTMLTIASCLFPHSYLSFRHGNRF